MKQLDFSEEAKLIKMLPILHEKVDEDIRAGKITQDSTFLADIRDYFMYLVMDCKKEDAPTLIDHFGEYTMWFEERERTTGICKGCFRASAFYIGFFFSLSQMLSLKYEITMLPMEKIKRSDFEESFKRTLTELGIK